VANRTSGRMRRPVRWAFSQAEDALISPAITSGGGVWARIFPNNLGQGGVVNVAKFQWMYDNPGSTIVRVRGELAVINTATAASPSQLTPFAAGLMLIPQQTAAQIDTLNLRTDLPTPGVEDADWLWFTSNTVGPSPGSAASIGERFITIDNQSMRKIRERNKELAFAFANLEQTTSQQLDYSVTLRVLVKTG